MSFLMLVNKAPNFWFWQLAIKQNDSTHGEMWTDTSMCQCMRMSIQWVAHKTMCHISGRCFSIVNIMAVFIWNVLKLSPSFGLMYSTFSIFKSIYTSIWTSVNQTSALARLKLLRVSTAACVHLGCCVDDPVVWRIMTLFSILQGLWFGKVTRDWSLEQTLALFRKVFARKCINNIKCIGPASGWSMLYHHRMTMLLNTIFSNKFKKMLLTSTRPSRSTTSVSLARTLAYSCLPSGVDCSRHSL